MGEGRAAADRHQPSKHQWLYLDAFVRPGADAGEWPVANSVSVALFQAVLDAFARAAGAGERAAIIVVLGNAGWHVGAKLKLPHGVKVCLPPPYKPELQPAE